MEIFYNESYLYVLVEMEGGGGGYFNDPYIPVVDNGSLFDETYISVVGDGGFLQ